MSQNHGSRPRDHIIVFLGGNFWVSIFPPPQLVEWRTPILILMYPILNVPMCVKKRKDNYTMFVHFTLWVCAPFGVNFRSRHFYLKKTNVLMLEANRKWTLSRRICNNYGIKKAFWSCELHITLKCFLLWKLHKCHYEFNAIYVVEWSICHEDLHIVANHYLRKQALVENLSFSTEIFSIASHF